MPPCCQWPRCAGLLSRTQLTAWRFRSSKGARAKNGLDHAKSTVIVNECLVFRVSIRYGHLVQRGYPGSHAEHSAEASMDQHLLNIEQRLSAICVRCYTCSRRLVPAPPLRRPRSLRLRQTVSMPDRDYVLPPLRVIQKAHQLKEVMPPLITRPKGGARLHSFPFCAVDLSDVLSVLPEDGQGAFGIDDGALSASGIPTMTNCISSDGLCIYRRIQGALPLS